MSKTRSRRATAPAGTALFDGPAPVGTGGASACDGGLVEQVLTSAGLLDQATAALSVQPPLQAPGSHLPPPSTSPMAGPPDGGNRLAAAPAAGTGSIADAHPPPHGRPGLQDLPGATGSDGTPERLGVSFGAPVAAAQWRPPTLGLTGTEPVAPAARLNPSAAPARPTPSALRSFEENPYALQRHRPVAAPGRQKKTNHVPSAVVLVVVAVVVGAVGYVGYRLTHPSVHRSPTAVALAFYDALQKGDTTGAISDVEPVAQSAAKPVLRSATVTDFARSALGTSVIQPATTSVDGTETDVILETCGANLSCLPALTIPTVEVAGSWYVDLTTWLQTVPAPSS